MSNPYIAVATANTLFYVLFSCPAVRFTQNHSDAAEAKDQAVIRQEGFNQVKTVVVLGTLTALFNVGFSRFSQHKLSREALFSVTAIVLAIHLLFKTLLTSLGSMGRSSSALRLPPLSRSLYAEFLERTPFTEENFQQLVRGIDIQEDTLFNCLREFIDLAKINLPENPEKRKQLIQSIVTEFKEKSAEHLISSFEARRLFEVVLKNHVIRLRPIQSSSSSSAPINAVRAVGVVQTDLSLDENYQALLGMGFDSQQLSTLVRFTPEGGRDILRTLAEKLRVRGVFQVLGENKRFFMDCLISIVNNVDPLDFVLIETVDYQIDEMIHRLSAAKERGNQPTYARLLILGFKHNKLQEFDAESIQVLDRYFQQLLTFVEPYTILFQINFDTFLEESVFAKNGPQAPLSRQDRAAILKNYCENSYMIGRFYHFGFHLEDCKCFQLEKFGMSEEDTFSLIDQCLLPHYRKRKVLPQTDEEKQVFFNYITTQLHLNIPQGQQLDRNGIINHLQPIVDHAIAHPEIYRSHQLYSGEPGYERQQKHGRGLNQPLIDAEPESEY